MWIVSKQSTQEELANTFRKLMKAPDILKIPGVHDGMAAITAKNIGFKAPHLPGAAYTASRGPPD
ncbi:methylisocitrate lyase, partial [Bacillus licheniformis]|nr:methylisocitrate lyase [Bacillus licheniformis]